MGEYPGANTGSKSFQWKCISLKYQERRKFKTSPPFYSLVHLDRPISILSAVWCSSVTYESFNLLIWARIVQFSHQHKRRTQCWCGERAKFEMLWTTFSIIWSYNHVIITYSCHHAHMLKMPVRVNGNHFSKNFVKTSII